MKFMKRAFHMNLGLKRILQEWSFSYEIYETSLTYVFRPKEDPTGVLIFIRNL